jgi:hypothetical protein
MNQSLTKFTKGTSVSSTGTITGVGSSASSMNTWSFTDGWRKSHRKFNQSNLTNVAIDSCESSASAITHVWSNTSACSATIWKLCSIITLCCPIVSGSLYNSNTYEQCNNLLHIQWIVVCNCMLCNQEAHKFLHSVVVRRAIYNLCFRLYLTHACTASAIADSWGAWWSAVLLSKWESYEQKWQQYFQHVNDILRLL